MKIYMKCRAAAFALLMSSASGFSQDSTSVNPAPDTLVHVLIIPFNSRMYDSDANNEIISASKVSYDQLVESFRHGICISIREKIPHTYEPKILFEDDSLRELEMIYGATVYQYLSLPGVLPAKGNNSPAGDGEPKIKNGQLVVKENHIPKFTGISVADTGLLPYFNRRYGTRLFIFINELDIKNDLSDYTAVGSNNYSREARIHYTVLDQYGKQLCAGIASSRFPSAACSKEEIINKYFPPAAGKIVTDMQQHLAVSGPAGTKPGK